MNIGIFSNKKAVETIKTVAIILLFAAMLGLFVYYTELQLGDLGVSGISRADKFPTDKMWVFSGNVNHALLSESASQFVCPASITFVNDASTFSVSPQKSALVTVYNDMVQYISEVLSPLYTAEDVSYDDYCNVVKSKNYTVISYNNDISAYILRLYCDKNAKGFYSGNSALIKRIMLTEDDHGRLVAYGISTDCKVMYFHPVSEAQAAAYPVNSAVISAYNSSNILVPSLLSFQSEFFSLPTTQASPDITFIPELQFYEAGISNPMSFIEKLTAQDSLIKNDRILSILKSFKINTGIVRHYADGNSLYFVE
ncbi:MAG: hypothetical protein IJO52_07730, partial [Clostridia bacterium]|nr:hypothetical protein [Clostridia bacterium]